MIHHWDHRWGTYEGQTEAQANQGRLPELREREHANPLYFAQPRYWVPSTDVETFLSQRQSCNWIIGWRDICRSVDSRTMISAVIPEVGVGGINLMHSPREGRELYCLFGLLPSFVFDYLCRQKVTGTHLNFMPVRQLPVLKPQAFCARYPWTPEENTLRDWLVPRALELTYTAWDLDLFASDSGWSGPPFRWDEERRFLLRSELDAAFFHLYLRSEANGEWRAASKADGCPYDEAPEQFADLKKCFPTPRDAVSYIMDTFTIIRGKDVKKYNGDYRTKRVILEIYDAMQESIRTGRPYQTRLDPSPADPRCCHPPRETTVDIPVAATNVLPFRRIRPARGDRYQTCVPLLSLKAAAGEFGDEQDVEFDDWVEIKASLPLRRGMFVAQVEGHSMEPLIPDGAYCLFQFRAPTFKKDMIGLFQLHAAEDPETGGRFTIKRLKISTTRNRDGELQRITTLVPDNPTFKSIPVEDEDVKFVAEFLEVLQSTVADAVDD